MNTHPKRKHAAVKETAEAQAVLPHVHVIVTSTGALDVTVDGTVLPPPVDGSWTRARFTDLLDAVTHDKSVGVRIEVREADGSVFTDLIQPRMLTPTPDPEPKPTPPTDVRGLEEPSLLEITADGFLPGEDVAVAVVISHTDAPYGTARTLLDLDQFPGHRGGVGEVIVFGRISGTIHIETLP